MSDKIIGKVMLKPETVVCGQSIFIEVTAPNGKEYTVSGETIVRINGIIGAQQYLQFDHPGDRTIFIVAARNGVVETTTAKVHVIDPDIPTTTLNGDGLRIMALMHNPMFKILPMLRIARSPRQPYVTALSLGRTLFVNGFSAGPDIHEISDQLNETLESKFEAIEALGQSMPIGPETLSSGPFIGEAVNGGRPIPFSLIDTSPYSVTQGLAGSQFLHSQHDIIRDTQNIIANSRDSDNFVTIAKTINTLLANNDIRHIPEVVATPIPGGVTSEAMPQARDNRLVFYWDFGDGTTISTNQLHVEHDFEAALDPDQEHHIFHVKVRIEEDGQLPVTVARTLYIHNAYALCKKLGTLIPKAHSTTFATKTLNGWEAAVVIDNVEPFPIFLTSRVVHPMLSTGDDLSVSGGEERLATPVTVPPKGSVVVPVTVSMDVVTKETIGFAVTFCGIAPDARPVRVETHFDIAAKDLTSHGTKIGDLSVGHLANFRQVISLLNDSQSQPRLAMARSDVILPSTVKSVFFNTMAGLTQLRSSKTIVDALPMATRSIARLSVLDIGMRDKIPSNLGLLTHLAATPKVVADLAHNNNPELFSIGSHLSKSGLLAQTRSSQTTPSTMEGGECDPDNVPDNIADDPDSDWVCQATPETCTIPTPGRFLNARKGDIVLSPGGPSIIGQLLRQVNPPQRYSHSGIMTRNYDQITHSTASEDRILNYPVGSILDKPAPSEGHRPDVVKYCWPGVITQKIEEALYGEEMADPEKPDNKYRISGFSHLDKGVEIDGNWEIIHPIVVKPDPLQEIKNPEIRRKLHEVATDALSQTGKSHYRFYCYSDPAIANDPTKVGAAGSGWAEGTWPSVCSSFIWHMLKKHGINLEGKSEFVTSSDLEEIDRVAGAQVGANTTDGLYLYSADERRAAGEYLYHTLTNMVEKKIEEDVGILAGTIDFLTDIADDVANQITNTFASDWSDTDSKDSDAWKDTKASNAVSPDNILFWDSPQLNGIYGFATPLIYREPRLETITVHRWHKVRIKGTIFGTVRYKNQPKQGALVQLYDGKTAFTDEQGNYRLEHVPFGKYEAKAFSDFGGVYLSAKQILNLNSQNMQMDIDLKAPCDLFRRLKIEARLRIFDYHLIGHNQINTENRYAELYIGPFGTHGETKLEVSADDGDNISCLRVVVDWNLDKSLTIYWEHSMLDDGDWIGPTDKTSTTFNLPEDYCQSWYSTISNGKDNSRVDVKFTNDINPN